MCLLHSNGTQALTFVSPQWRELNQQEDEQLAALFLSGQQDALAVLFDRYHRLVYSIAGRILRDPGEAEDVVQTVFLDISRAMANFDPGKGTLKVWLMQYAYHRALHRKRHLQANRFYQWVDLESSAGELRVTSNMEHALEREQLIQEWLGKLNSRCRHILTLAYCEGLTAEEIAHRLQRSVHAVRHDLYRSLSYLRKEAERKRTREEARRQAGIDGVQKNNAQAF